MNTNITEEIKKEWMRPLINSPLSRVKTSIGVNEKVEESNKVFHLERISSTSFKLIGWSVE